MSVYICKTYFDCVERATDHVARFPINLDNPIIVFCEDKLTLEVERALAKKRGGNFNAEVLSLGRYASKRLTDRKYLSKEGMAMAVKKILTEVATELTALKKTAGSPSLASETSELLAQLKSAKIDPYELLKATENLGGRSAAKIRDIATVFARYEKFLSENGLTDSNNALSGISEAVKNDETLKNAAVVFIGFSSITRQTAEAIDEISKAAKSADYFAVKGENEDLFVNEFYSFVKKYDRSPTVCPSSVTDEAARLLDGLFDPTVFSKNGKFTKKVYLYEAKDTADEAEFVARRIRRSVIEKGARYRDIAIGAADYDSYSLILKRKLADYDIPFYSDEKTKLASTPVASLIDCLFRAFSPGCDLDEVKEVIGNVLFIPDKTVSDEILRLITSDSSTYKSFINDFTVADDEYKNGKIKLLAEFLKTAKRSDSAKNYAESVRGFLSGCNAEENAKTVAEKLREYKADEKAAIAESQIEKFLEILDETEEILGNTAITADAYRRILLAGETSSEMSVVQQRNDCVYVGDLKNCRFRQYETLYAIGLTSDVPATQNDGAILLDGDIADLEKLSLKIEPKIKVVNDREKEAVGLALASFKNRLVLTRPALARDGKPTAKSGVLDFVEKIFSDETAPFTRFTASDLEHDKHDDYTIADDYLARRPAFFSLVKKGNDFKDGATDDEEEIASVRAAFSKAGDNEAVKACDRLVGFINRKKLFAEDLPCENYFANGNVSASAIECFYSCPYKCFMRYCIGAADEDTGKIKSMDYGNVLHKVVELFVKQISTVKSEAECKELSDKIIGEILDGDEYKRFRKRPDFAYALERLTEEAAKLCVKLFREFAASDFKPLYEEVWFGKGGVLPAYPINAKRHSGYRLQGKIDRVDVYEKYGRIIDYKSGKAEDKVSDKNFFTGRHVQLYLYMNALAKAGYIPAGAYYYALDDAFKKIDDKAVSMYGKTLAEENILRATDKNFYDNRTSDIIDARIETTKKDGDKAKGSTVAEENVIKAYMRYAEILAEKAVDYVLDGVIVPAPYKGECEYCEYGSACGFGEDSDYEERDIPDRIMPSHIVKAIEEENSKGGKENG